MKSHWRAWILSSAATLAAEARPASRRQLLRRCIRRFLAVLPVAPPRGACLQEAALPAHRTLVFWAGLQHVGNGHAGFTLRVWHRRRHPGRDRRDGAVLSDLDDYAIGRLGSPRTILRLLIAAAVAARHNLWLVARLPGGVVVDRQSEFLAASPVLPRRRRSTALRLRRNHADGDEGDVAAAERAVGVRLEPGVDARQVESVAALGQQPQALAVPELAQADGAVRGVDEPVAALVLAHGDLSDQRLVHPVRRRDLPLLLSPGIAPAVATASATTAAAGAGAKEPAPQGAEGAAVLGDDGVVADEEEGAGEHPDDGDDEGREGGAGVAVAVAAGAGDVEDRRRGWEDEVAPLRAVHAAQALGAIPGRLVGHPRRLRPKSPWSRRRIEHCGHGRQKRSR
ncbi:hypothetical protein VPH35_117699 [Triticum aestivum]